MHSPQWTSTIARLSHLSLESGGPEPSLTGVLEQEGMPGFHGGRVIGTIRVPMGMHSVPVIDTVRNESNSIHGSQARVASPIAFAGAYDKKIPWWYHIFGRLPNRVEDISQYENQRFPNPAQICYMNSCLQSLLTLEDFIADIIQQEQILRLSSDAAILRSLINIQRSHFSGETRVKVHFLSALKKAVACNDPEFIDLHQKDQELKYNCQCDATKSNQHSSFATLPRVLILHLKRFSFTSDRQLFKKHDPVVLSRELVVPLNQGAFCYSLVSTINHIGSTPESGHYICDAVDPEVEPSDATDRWFTYSDDLVAETHGAHENSCASDAGAAVNGERPLVVHRSQVADEANQLLRALWHTV
ncbi:hypothetical protein INR49_001059, partial [Caranx melampygus]